MKFIAKACVLLPIFTLSLVGCVVEKNSSQSGLNQGELKMSYAITGGIDERRKSIGGNVNNILLNKVGKLISPTFANGKEVESHDCTATMISKKHAITAAHCLHRPNGSFVRGIYFIPGKKNEGHMPYGRFHVEKSYFPKSYFPRSLALEKSNFDIAVIEFGSNNAGKFPGDVVGFYSYWGRDSISSDPTLTVGYPKDKNRNSEDQYYQMNCGSKDINGRYFEFDCDAEKGQSGASLIGYSQSRNLNYVYGVISSSFGGVNYGAQINEDRHRIIDMILNGTFTSSKSIGQYNEEWITRNHKLPVATVNILFKNNCSTKDVQFIAYYQPVGQSDWDMTGLLTIPSHFVIELARTELGTFYVAATSDSGRSWITKSDRRYFVKSVNREINFQKVDVDRYGDHVQVFGCR